MATKIPLEANGLYILLSMQDKPGKWHWGLYFHLGDNGWIFHAIQHALTPAYAYQHRVSDNVENSLRVVTGLRVASIDDKEMQQALRNFLGRYEPGFPMDDPNQFGRLTCRTWVLEALDRLNQAGHISILPGLSPQHIEGEAFDEASKIYRGNNWGKLSDSKYCNI